MNHDRGSGGYKPPSISATAATAGGVVALLLIPVLILVHNQVQHEFEQQGRSFLEQLNRHLSQTESVLTGFSVLVDRDSDQSDPALLAFARHMLEEHPYLHELNLFRRVPAERAPALEQRMQAAGFDDFRVRGYDFATGGGWLDVPEDREVLYPMVFRIAKEHTVELLGMDPSISPGIRNTFTAAVTSGGPMASPPFLRTTGQRRGMVIFRPVLTAAMPAPAGTGTSPSLVTAVMMRAEELVPANRLPDHVAVQVRAGPWDPARGLLYERASNDGGNFDQGLVFQALTAAGPGLEVTLSAPVVRPVLGHSMLLASLVPTTALALLLAYLVQVRRARAAERRAAAAALFEEKERAEVTLNAIAEAVIGTDRAGRIIYANAAAERLLGRRPDPGTALTEVVVLETGADGDPVAPPTDRAIAEDRPVQLDGEVRLRAHQRLPSVEVTASPLHDHQARCIGVVVVLRDVTEQRRLVREIAYQAEHDHLTGLLNRRSLEQQLVGVLQNTPEGEGRHTFAFIDLDQFKAINDTHGHLQGDAFLKAFAERLAERFRRHDIVARLGGDEFAVVLLDCPLAKARAILEDLARDLVDNPVTVDNLALPVRFSAGLVTVGDAWRSLDGCLRAADRACYVAKDAGRGRVRVTDDSDG